MSQAPVFKRAAILGLGLIGSSLARALHKAGLSEEVVAFDPDASQLAHATQQGFIHQSFATAKDACKGADIIVLACPPAAFDTLAAEIGPHIGAGAMVMDTGSIKQAALDAINPHIPENAFFVGAHPIAGSEQSGAAAGSASLFEKKLVVLCPAKNTPAEAVQMAALVWQACGATTELLPPSTHDAIYAAISHLPQLVAFASTPLTKNYHAGEEFARFTRLQQSNPQLWADIFIQNATNLIPVLGTYIEAVFQIATELAQSPDDAPGDSDSPHFCITHLFPRIAASCLISTIMVAEHEAQMRFVKYAGRGFADMASPIIEAPDDDLKHISNNSKQLSVFLEEFLGYLNRLHSALQSRDSAVLALLLTQLQQGGPLRAN